MDDRFGINMKRYCRDHEAAVAKAAPSPELLADHMEMLRRLQHERLIHLIVLVMTALAELFTVDLALLHPETNPAAGVAVLVLAVLLGFYFYHYFFLENTVQRWYVVADRLKAAVAEESNRPGQEERP